jgi:hypothetical protein
MEEKSENRAGGAAVVGVLLVVGWSLLLWFCWVLSVFKQVVTAYLSWSPSDLIAAN